LETLVLNAFYMPITVIPWQKAITLWCKGKIDIIDNYDREIRSPSIVMKVPSVVRYMGKHKGKSRIIKYSKSMIYKRDRGRCQYCNNRVSKNKATLDHVLPRSRGGLTSFTNIVIACSRCNQHKKDRTPEEAGMQLITIPSRPSALPAPFLNLGLKRLGIPDTWIPFIRDDD
jgi:5-methylcytosine-specific restriction endonuclease McrA